MHIDNPNPFRTARPIAKVAVREAPALTMRTQLTALCLAAVTGGAVSAVGWSVAGLVLRLLGHPA